MKTLRNYLLSLLLFATAAFADDPQAKPMVNVYQELAPWQAYYNSRTDWPKHYGYKAFKRHEWDVLQRGFPSGLVPVGGLWDAMQEKSRMPRVSLDDTWLNLGPYNHGGRTRTLKFHPDNSNIMFAGSVGGGLFKSTDGGDNWFPITEQLQNIAIGCLDICASDPNIMYMGTGEGYFNGDGLAGIGLLKSNDGGVSWNPCLGMSYQISQGNAVLKVNVDPRDPNIVLASTNNGLRRSVNGGQTFVTVLGGDVKELVRDPMNPDTLFACPAQPFGGGTAGIYRSGDNGQSFHAVNTGLPPTGDIGRIVLSIYPENSQIVYAGICGTFSFNETGTIGIFRTVDGGDTWTQMSQGNINHYSGQGWYDMSIGVKPGQSNTVFSSGLDMYRSNNSGLGWTRITHWDYPYGHAQFVHADHHGTFFDPANSNIVWEITDGGIFKSVNSGTTWTEKNIDYVTYQYYAMGNATIDTMLAYAGAQDNGTTQYDGDGNWDAVFGGDGGYCVVDYTDNNTLYVEYQNGNRARTDNGCQSFSGINTGCEQGPWVTPMILDPFDHLKLYTTGTESGGQVWYSDNQGRAGAWHRLGGTIGGGMQCLEVTPAMQGRVYCGTSGQVYRYDTNPGSWTNVTGNLPNAHITHVIADPSNPNLVYVTLSGFGNGHVYKSAIAGTQWVNITNNLPDAPTNDLVVDPNDANTLYVGTDIGAFYTNNSGGSWSIYGEGLPNVRIDDMELQTVTGKLRVATHGRGMWEIPTGSIALNLLYPSGGEILPIGSNLNLRWSGFLLGGNVGLEINRNYPGGAWQTLFASTPNDGQESWTITGPESDHVRFRIHHLTIPNHTDTSSVDSRFAFPSLRVLSPNGGETVFTGIRDTVSYVRTLVTDSIRIELNRNYPNGEWEEIVSNFTDTDRYPLWVTRVPASTHCRIRITSQNNPNLTDVSDADFTLRAPQINLLNFGGGEEVPIGVATNIGWAAPEHQGNVRILLNRSYPDSNAWVAITNNTVNDGIFSWTPTGPGSTTCRLRIATLFDPRSYAESASDFSILDLAADEHDNLPTSFKLHELYPNPFNPITEISFDLPSRTKVQVKIFNRLGQEVSTLKDDFMDAGIHKLIFDGSNLASGIYFIRVNAYGESGQLKAVLLK